MKFSVVIDLAGRQRCRSVFAPNPPQNIFKVSLV
nr:MAG TPA: Nitrate/nitrite sensor protein narX [Caudoviricetes sp.]